MVDVMRSSMETKHIAQGGGESLDGRHRAGGPAVVQQQVGSTGHAVRDGRKKTALNEWGWLAGRGQGARRAAHLPIGFGDLGAQGLRGTFKPRVLLGASGASTLASFTMGGLFGPQNCL